MFNKKTRIHNVIFILAIIGVILLGLRLLLWVRNTHNSSQIQQEAKGFTGAVTPTASPIYNKSLLVNGFSIPVAIADTPALQQQGLSDTVSLPANNGMLFVFSKPDKVGFWMKDMQYPLDFVWIDSSMKIIAIDTNIAADTYPKIFYPPQPVRYVLEVNADFSTVHHLSVGQQLTLTQ